MEIAVVGHEGGRVCGAITLEYPGPLLELIVNLMRITEDREDKVQVFFEEHDEHVVCLVSFECLISQEKIKNFLTDGRYVVDLSKLASQPKARIIIDAMSVLELGGWREAKPWFDNEFTVALGSAEDDEAFDVHWRTFVSSFGDKLPPIE